MSFESLGGSGAGGGCEFGGFQRSCGAEPLGLLRWASVPPDALIQLLQSRFEGLGEPANTEIYLDGEDPEQLWRVRDTIYGIGMHTFVPSATTSLDSMKTIITKRMCYLRQKLIADLEEASKIFVFKLAEQSLDRTQILAIRQSLNAYGRCMIVSVCPADSQHPAEEIQMVTDDFYVAYIDFSGGAASHRERQAAWLHICRNILMRRQI